MKNNEIQQSFETIIFLLKAYNSNLFSLSKNELQLLGPLISVSTFWYHIIIITYEQNCQQSQIVPRQVPKLVTFCPGIVKEKIVNLTYELNKITANSHLYVH